MTVSSELFSKDGDEKEMQDNKKMIEKIIKRDEMIRRRESKRKAMFIEQYIAEELQKLQDKKTLEQEERLKRPNLGLFQQLEREMIYKDKKMNSIEAVAHARELNKDIFR